jgi:hypothetical protein
MPGRTKWFKRKIDAEIELRLMLLTMRDRKANGNVLVYSCRKMMETASELIAFLNGEHTLKLIKGYAHTDGVIVNRLNKNSEFNLRNAWFFPEIHPSPRHASWIYCIDNNMDMKELVVRAPDPKALHIAFKLAGITTDQDGVQMTAEIAKYVWNYTHNIMVEGYESF